MQLRFCYSMYYCMLPYPISFYIFRCRFLNVSLSAAILPPPPPCVPPTAPAYVLPGAHIGLLICRCRPSALLIYLCASVNGRCPSGVRLWSTLDFCRTVWELMSPKVKDRHGKYTVQAVGAFYIFRAFTVSGIVDGDIYSH